MKRFVCFLAVFASVGCSCAEVAVAHVTATASHADCLYAAGERADVSFSFCDANGVSLKAGHVKVRVDNFGTRELAPERTVDLARENPVRVSAVRETPGFMRITLSSAATNEIRLAGNGLWGRHLQEFIWGVGYDVGRIASGTPDVADFDTFWSNAVARLDATVPVDARLEPLPSPNPAFRVYRVSVSTVQDRRVWGWITEPSDLTKGPYPVHVEASGAGEGWTSAHPGLPGAIVCRMSVHTFPQPEGSGPEVAAERRRRYLEQVAKYATPNGVDDYYYAGVQRGREGYFYYAVILGLNRMVDWLVTRPECDASRVSYGSTSQGGGLGLALACLNRHISRTVVYVPAITDLLGFRAEEGRQSGWPELVEHQKPENRAAAEANAPYFCGVNFARRITKPIRFVVGYVDLTCPPNAVYAAYNACPSKDKGIVGGVAMGHRVHEDFYAKGLAWELRPQTELLFSFDTEDFTNPRSWDSAKRLAEMFAEEGITAQFQVVGSFARQLERHGRRDVIEALAKHDIGTHTLYHSVHPDVLELSDGADYELAYQRVMAQESECVAELKRIFGKDRLWGSNPPGLSESYVADRVYYDLGIRYGVGPHYTDFFDSDIWYAGQRRIPYSFSWENYIAPATKTNAIRDAAAVVEHLAKVKRGIVFCHPNKVSSLDYWDELNYNGGNYARWGEWVLSKPRPAEETERYLAWIRDILRRLKADGRFRFTTVKEIDKSTRPRVAIRRADLSAIRAHFLENGLKPLRTPASWCVADVFCAVVAMLRGEESFLPDNAYGFLSKPEGVRRPMPLTRRGLVTAAKAMDVSKFLPARIEVEGAKVGPADFLYAALEVLATGADTVTAVPREQLGAFKGTPVERLETWTHDWIHARDFKDAYAIDRLRWQLWTLRWE